MSEDDPLLINHILWTDESKFTNNGILNKQNNLYWSNENPHCTVPTNFQTCWGTNVGLIGDVCRNIYYQQDGAPAHNARIVQELLRVRFGEKFIATHGPVEWPPRSPDLTPLDFFLWGHLKNVVYTDPPINIQDLKNKITHACYLLNEN
ncbi:uncharacterized protein LOC111033573 [Myzus persicae]|uniref:uncharacterized protein LOC111033573 n=1 Tax=Myzus persicae TaxID=13164 RepID=UPI000B936C01|nr:uncharacterized protein LOC111033573 [Myzus persicae]